MCIVYCCKDSMDIKHSAFVFTFLSFIAVGLVGCTDSDLDLHAFEIEPQTLNIQSESGDNKVVFTIEVKSIEQSSEFEGCAIVFENVNGQILDLVLNEDDLVSGTLDDGSFSTDRKMSVDDDGVWNLKSISVTDITAHEKEFNRTEAMSRGFDSSFTVVVDLQPTPSSIPLPEPIDVSCPNDCSEHGLCSEEVCKCDYGFVGVDCGEVGFILVVLIVPLCILVVYVVRQVRDYFGWRRPLQLTTLTIEGNKMAVESGPPGHLQASAFEYDEAQTTDSEVVEELPMVNTPGIDPGLDILERMRVAQYAADIEQGQNVRKNAPFTVDDD